MLSRYTTKIGRQSELSERGQVHLDVRKPWHGQGLDDVPMPAGNALIFLDAEQHMRAGLPWSVMKTGSSEAAFLARLES